MAAVDIQREALRNRLLRRADWRFLLPDPQPATVVCLGGAALAEAALIADRVADEQHARAGVCDLAVAAGPDGAALRAAWAALRPGGACYTEWRSPLAGGPRGVRRRLEAAGFEQVACYWPWPWPARGTAQFWLPLDAPGALRAFLESRVPDRGAARRAGYALRRALWRLALRAGVTLPICAVARKPAPPDERADDLFETIRAGWSGWGFGPAPDRLAWLLLTGGRRSINKVVGLVSDERDGQPRVALKLPRVPESIPALRREAATLRAVHALRPGLSGVPRVLFYQEHAGFAALGETALAGRQLYTGLERRSYRELALQATDWLADLAGRPQPRPRASWWGRLVEPVLADFGASFGDVVDLAMIRETRARLAALGDLPLVYEQRDFSPWNVLIAANGALVVLDWESAETQGLPGMDLVYFLAYLAFFLDGAMESGRFRESYRAALDPATFTGAVQAECLRRYAARLGVEVAALQSLRLLAWLLHSRSEYLHFSADAARRPAREALRRSLFVSLWEEELGYV